MSTKNAKKPKKIPFTAEEDEQLIEHVSSFEYIWNMKHADYKSGHKKDKVWQDIADKLEKKRDECQARWKSIRDHYKRQRKEDIGRTGPAAKKKRASYWDRLSFLDATENERDTFSNISAETPESIQNNHQHTQQDSMNGTSPTRNEFETLPNEPEETSEPIVPRPERKSKVENSAIVKYLREKKHQNTQFNDSIKELLKCDEQDDVDLFFKSIAMTVKKFQPQLVSKTKIKVLEIVSDMEQLQHTEVNRFANHPSFLAPYNSNPHSNTSLTSSSLGYTAELSNQSSHHSSTLASPSSGCTAEPSNHFSHHTSPTNYQSELSNHSSHHTSPANYQSELSKHFSHDTSSANYQSELSNHSSHHTSSLTSPPIYQSVVSNVPSDLIIQAYDLCQLDNAG